LKNKNEEEEKEVRDGSIAYSAVKVVTKSWPLILEEQERRRRRRKKIWGDKEEEEVKDNLISYQVTLVVLVFVGHVCVRQPR